MLEAENLPDADGTAEKEPSTEGPSDIFPEFEELRQQIAKRIQDNQRFLERVFDEDFAEDADDGGGPEEEAPFEEL
ncbi:MAG: hypothetical protein PWP34_1646 [Desulfuromonadales bacterium]|jgi:hypothetical protein|nr:hypothetical protein [Desulfuromonadales bacterium]